MKAVIVDFEATDVSVDAQATELGILGVEFKDGKLRGVEGEAVKTFRCKPDRDISFGAMAITGIFKEDLAELESHKIICEKFIPKDLDYIIGHNIDFDLRVASNAGVDVSKYKAICTLAIFRRLYPSIDSHTLGAISCMLDYEYARKSVKSNHTTAGDVSMLARLLYKTCIKLNIGSFDELYLFSESCRKPIHFPFGKNKGVSIKELANDKQGAGYLKWVLENIKDNDYLILACEEALKESGLN